MLFVNKLPEEGGRTSLADTLAAYDALPPEMKERIEGLVASHYSGPGILGDHMSARYGKSYTHASVRADTYDRLYLYCVNR
jgi:alpha-ketoglutarate-dependent taurine dioxygenase